jgi:Sec-independent protein translocase protein TatA
MFGVGPQEVVIIVGLILVIFGPAKAAGIARDLGRWVNEARRPVEELKEELASSVEEDKDESLHSAKEKLKTKAAVGKDQDD